MKTAARALRQTSARPSVRDGGRRGSREHTVQFYEDDAYLCDVVAAFLFDGLMIGQPAVAIVRPERRSAIAARLESKCLDVGEASLSAQLTFVDAHEALADFMSGPLPDERRFETAMGGIISESLGQRPNASLRVYGEMADVLLGEGKAEAAIRVEDLWNRLGDRHPFSLLCTYAMGDFREETHIRQLEEVCARHGQVFPAESFPRADEEAARRAICVLQQRAKALETEVGERSRAEQELRQALDEAARANRAKTEFLAMMSHELRTPLNAILGYQDLLDHGVGGAVSDAQRRFLGRIKAGAQHLLGMIDQILRLAGTDARASEPRVEPVDIAALVGEIGALMRTAAAHKGLDLDIRVPRRRVTCRTDADKVKQILLNLLSNAVKFTDEGSVSLRVRRNGGTVLVQVRDTGAGIHPADLARIFDPFVQVDASATRSHGGTGLGLPVSRNLARLLRGDIDVASEPGEGSIFTLRLPLGDLPVDRD